MPASLIDELKRARHEHGPYVVTYMDAVHAGKPIVGSVLDGWLRSLMQKAGIERSIGRIGWHDLRHTYASHLAMRGVPLKAIQELLGHASIKDTMRYAHLSPEAKASAVSVLDHADPHGTIAAQAFSTSTTY